MPRRRAIAEDIEVLRLKLRAVDEYIATYERHAEQLRAAMLTEDVRQIGSPNGHASLDVLKDELLCIGRSAVPTSLIDGDLNHIRHELGPSHATQIVRATRRMLARWKAVKRRMRHGPASEKYRATVTAFGIRIDAWIRLALKPATTLRSRLLIGLGRASTIMPETPGKQARRHRDEIIRELAAAHSTKTPHRVLKVALKEPRLSDMQPPVKLTIDVVRNALKTRTRRG